MRLVWDEDAWADYEWWQVQDRKMLKRINHLIRDVHSEANAAERGNASLRIVRSLRLIHEVGSFQRSAPALGRTARRCPFRARVHLAPGAGRCRRR
ncbi:type II toxin-antitoxin system YoeB family toxin [Arthrobacter crystallopoietes]|uniref:type II toxin-antitoxin system YoeB family toxin n=1 Tax=Crystallibacter crystallopoietes TaxID=37928 RepID=UPI003D1A8384